MDLYQSLFEFSKENIESIHDTYIWPINLEHLPVHVTLEENNSYKQNLALRLILNQQFLISKTLDDKYKIIKWYIHHWGGVKKNSQETLEEYTQTAPQQLIQRGVKGIASWSKALAIIDPAQYAIYDARVASAINALQIIDHVVSPIYFPPLKSRNTLINFFQKKLQPTLNQWNKMRDQDFYQEYLKLLHQVAHDLGEEISHHDIEMLLFAQAEELSFRAAAHTIKK